MISIMVRMYVPGWSAVSAYGRDISENQAIGVYAVDGWYDRVPSELRQRLVFTQHLPRIGEQILIPVGALTIRITVQNLIHDLGKNNVPLVIVQCPGNVPIPYRRLEKCHTIGYCPKENLSWQSILADPLWEPVTEGLSDKQW